MPSTPDILDRLDDLPSLPAVYHRAREILDDPEGPLEAVGQVIASDAAMTARLLRVANSALYGLPSRVASVPQALTIIGAAETHSLILSTALLSVFHQLPLGTVSMRSFWEHSIATGVAARTIARRGGLGSPERFYLAGLLHDIGRLPLFMLEPQTARAALQAHHERQGHLWEIEQRLFATHHGDIGAALMTRWQIPAVFRDCASLHHAPCQERHPAQEVAVTHLADLIVNSLRIGTSGTRWVPALIDCAWRDSGLAVADLPAIVDLVVSTSRGVISAFLEP